MRKLAERLRNGLLYRRLKYCVKIFYYVAIQGKCFAAFGEYFFTTI